VGNAAHVTALHYEHRRPETTSLYRLIATHLETFLAEARAAHDRGVPRYVERELRAYLACGIHAHGFLRARCSTCRKEILVAFLCKLRGACPSCNARRMCSTHISRTASFQTCPSEVRLDGSCQTNCCA